MAAWMARGLAFALGLLTLASWSPIPARAAEVQVALDPTGRIKVVDALLARKLGMFVDQYPGFDSARLFQLPDSSYVLEITTVQNGQTARERVPRSREEVEAMRAQIGQAVAEKTPQALLNQEGRPLLLAGTTLMGLGFWGWAIPAAANMTDETAFGATYMLTAASSFFIPMLGTGSSEVTWAQSNLALTGAVIGPVHGWLLYDLGGGDDEQALLGLMTATSLAECFGGYAWARGARLDAGTTNTILTGELLGLLYGFGISEFAGFLDGNEDASTAATVLTTSVAGIVGGRLWAGKRRFTYGDASLVRSASFIGSSVGLTIADAGNPSEADAYFAGAMAGSILGLAAGDRLVRGRDYTAGQSILVGFGTVAGASMGLGVAFLATQNGDDATTLALGLTTAGAAGGYLVTLAGLGDRVPTENGKRSSWKLDVSPAGLIGAIAPRPHRGAAENPPIVTLSCRF